MSRPGPWHRARNPGFDDPFTSIVAGDTNNRPLGLVDPNVGDMWGAGARYNFRPRWRDPQGNFVNPETGEILSDWQSGRGSGRYSVPDRQNVQRVDPTGRVPGGGGQAGGNIGNDMLPQLNPQQIPNLTGGGGQMTTPGGQQSTDMFPWLQRWTGGFQAPLSPYEQQGLGGLSDFVGGGMGLGQSNDYLNSVIGGDYLSPDNPYFDQIQSSGQTLLKQQQDQTLKELQSRAAAGGNALSGALMGQEQQYLQGSNAAFDNMMAQLRADQYARERGYQQGASQQVGQNAQTQLGGYGSLMGWGAVPRNIQTNEMQGQYADWARQIGAMRDQYQYPDQLLMAQLSHGYPNYYQQQYGDSGAQQLAALFSMLGGGGGVDWGGIVNGIGSLFGGGGDSTDQTQSQDGHPVSYDGSQPSSYKDVNWYNKALSEEQAKAAMPPKQQNAGLNAGLGSSALMIALLQMLFGGGSGGKKGSGVSFGGGSGNNSFANALRKLFGGGNKGNAGSSSVPTNSVTGEEFGPWQDYNPFDSGQTGGNPGPWNPDWNPYDPNQTNGNPGPWAGPWADTGGDSGGGGEFNPFQGDNPGPWAPPDDGGDNYDFGT